jgi:hypothetical protein
MSVAGTALALLWVRISFTGRDTMPTRISTKLAALAVAMTMNSLIISGVAYVFSLQACRSNTISAERGTASACSGASSCVMNPIV